MKIKFKNGSTMEAIDSTNSGRSRCDEEKIKMLQDIFKNPYLLSENMYCDLRWYQKLRLKISYLIYRLGLYKRYRRR